jgi:plasmid stabilization system protein ParE
MGQVNWTAEAERWLRDIHDYIAADKPEAASRVIGGIYSKVQLLRRFPELGYRYEQSKEPNVRILLYGHYRIAYGVRPDRDIDILGVFHAALDVDRYLFPQD